MTTRPVDPIHGRHNTEWMTDAACAQIGPADTYYYPDKGVTTEPAKRVCNTICPVRQQCLAYAMATEQYRADRFGVWGGLSPQEREDLARKRRKDAAA